LKDLEADHVLARTDYKEVPPRVDYALTPLGRSLADAIVPLCVHLGNREHGGNDKHLRQARHFPLAGC
jgi:DNA-binding HxlR family transcriptional regulator